MDIYEVKEKFKLSDESGFENMDTDDDLDDADDSLRSWIDTTALIKRAEAISKEYKGTHIEKLADDISDDFFVFLKDASLERISLETAQETVDYYTANSDNPHENKLLFLHKLKLTRNFDDEAIKDQNPIALILAVYFIMDGLEDEVHKDSGKTPFLTTLIKTLKDVCKDPTGIKSSHVLCEEVRNKLGNLMIRFLIDKEDEDQLTLQVLHACGALAYYLYVETMTGAQFKVCHYSEFALPLLNRICHYLRIEFHSEDQAVEMDLKKTSLKLEDTLRNIVKNSELGALEILRSAVIQTKPTNFRNLINEIWEQALGNKSSIRKKP